MPILGRNLIEFGGRLWIEIKSLKLYLWGWGLFVEIDLKAM